MAPKEYMSIMRVIYDRTRNWMLVVNMRVSYIGRIWQQKDNNENLREEKGDDNKEGLKVKGFWNY